MLPDESAKCAYMEEALRSCLGGREAFRKFQSVLSSPHVGVQWRIGEGRGDGEGQGGGQSDELELLPPPRAPGGVARREGGVRWKEREEEGIGSREEEVIGTHGDVVSLADSEAEAYVSEGDKGGSEVVSREAVEKKREIMKRGGVLKQLKVGRRGGSKVELLRQVAVERQVASGKGDGEKAPIAED